MKPSWLGNSPAVCSTPDVGEASRLVLGEVELLARRVDERTGDPSGVGRSIDVRPGQRTLEP
jgi:hypothetical protein